MRLCILFLTFLLAGVVYAAPVIHVAPTGNDANPGTEDAPTASLEAALNRLRETRDARLGGEIRIHPGTYFLSQSLNLTEADSGTSEAPIVLGSVGEGAARLVGGRVIPAEAFGPIEDASVRARIDSAVVDSIRVADLRSLGVVDLGDFPDQFTGTPVLPELFFNGERMALSRWPNDGWAEVAEVLESGPAPWRNHVSDGTAAFRYEGDRPARWLSAPAVWLHGYWCFDWASDVIRVGSIDPEDRRITLALNHHYGLGGGNPAKRRFAAINLLEELDSSGEYYIDRDHGLLYFHPPSPLENAEIVLSLLTDPILRCEGTSHLRIEGIEFDMTAGDAIHLTNGEVCRIDHCIVRNSGLAGIVIEGGTDHQILNCEIHHTGASGVRISGGDRRRLIPSKHRIFNNHLHHVSRRQRTAAYHIEVRGVGIQIDHNLIHDAPHQSILLAGNDHLIEFNEIHDISKDSDDCGAFYMGRNPSERGNIIRWNLWRDIGSSFNHGSCAVYFDDGTGGQLVEGNVFFRAAGGSFGAVFLHGGHDNRVVGNLFIDCKRAVGHAPWRDAMWREWLKGELWTKRLREEVDVESPLYQQRYPDLVDFFTPDARPRINFASDNVLLGCGSVSSGDWDLVRTSVRNDIPEAARGERPTFEFLNDPEWWRQFPNVKPIPFDEIGLVREGSDR